MTDLRCATLGAASWRRVRHPGGPRPSLEVEARRRADVAVGAVPQLETRERRLSEKVRLRARNGGAGGLHSSRRTHLRAHSCASSSIVVTHAAGWTVTNLMFPMDPKDLFLLEPVHHTSPKCPPMVPNDLAPVEWVQYHPGWNPYMYNMQGPSTPWFPQQRFQYPPTGAAMMPPASNADVFAAPFVRPELPFEVTAEVELEGLAGQEEASSSAGKKKSGTRTKQSNFNPDEDVNLVKSWLEISCDPITSNSQKKERMWDRILERYNFRRGHYPERTNPSGMTDADKTARAAANYAVDRKHNFPFMHCWDIMKNEPKWQVDPTQAGFRGSIHENFNSTDPESDSPSTARKRPMGRDTAKEAKKKSNCSTGSTSSSEYASKMQDLSIQKISIMQEENNRKVDRFQQLSTIEEKRYEEMQSHNKPILDIEQEKVRIMRDKLEMQKEKEEKLEDERILAINLDACTSYQRLYYQALQEEIMEKMAS